MNSTSRRLGCALALALAAAVAPASARQANACTCELPSPSREFAQADFVFYGRAVHAPILFSWRSGGLQTTTLKAVRIWKGPSLATYTLTTHTFGPSCGVTFTEGEDYLVYAWYGTVSGQRGTVMTTSSCTGTRRADRATDRLRELGPGRTLAGICPQVADRLPPGVAAAAMDDPWSFGGWGRLANEGRPPSPYNPERTWLSLRNPHAPHGPMNAPIWKAYCP